VPDNDSKINLNKIDLGTVDLKSTTVTQDLLNRTQSQLVLNESRIKELEDGLKKESSSVVTLEEKLNTAQKQLNEKDAKIVDLETQIKTGFAKAGADDGLLEKLTQSQLVNMTLSKEAELNTNKAVELEVSLKALQLEFKLLNNELRDAKDLLKREQEIRNRLAGELEAANQKTQAAFEMADLSKYLTGVINDFNEAVNTDDASVNYIIKGLDVEMKAYISKTEGNRLLMTAPSLGASNEESLSLIKFSIGAAPKI